MIDKVKETVAFILEEINIKPRFGVILGTGLGALVNDIDISHTLNYTDIPNFPLSTVEGHSGKLIFGKLEGREVVAMQGRFHYYEGYSMQEVTFPVRVMKLLGIERLFISNAAGGLNPDFQLSDLMVIDDHINLMPENPLVGENWDDFGPRFPDMSEPYDQDMIARAMEIAKQEDIPTHQGVYVGVTGPNLETKAEYKYLRVIGADAVGMSTIPENIVARHMELPCFAISVITDLCTPGNIEKVTVEKVIAAAMKAEPGMTRLLKALIADA